MHARFERLNALVQVVILNQGSDAATGQRACQDQKEDGIHAAGGGVGAAGMTAARPF